MLIAQKNLSDSLDQIEEDEFCLSEKTKNFAITFDKKEFTFEHFLCGQVVQNVRRQIEKRSS